MFPMGIIVNTFVSGGSGKKIFKDTPFRANVGLAFLGGYFLL